MNADLARFDRACKGLTGSGFVTAAGHVTDVLKTVAGAPTVLSVIKNCAAHFNFETEFNRSKVPVGQDDYRLLPPSGITDFIAYAFGVLLHIDLGDLNFTRLLTTYFRDTDINASFQSFCAGIVDKFRRAVETLLDAPATEIASLNEAAAEADAVSVPPADSCAEGVAEIEKILSEYVKQVGTSQLSVRDKEELTVVADNLKNALSRAPEQLFAAALGFKFACTAFSTYQPYAEAVLNKLNNCGLIC